MRFDSLRSLNDRSGSIRSSSEERSDESKRDTRTPTHVRTRRHD